MAALILLWLGCSVPCRLEATGDCAASFTACSDEAGYRRLDLACVPDPDDDATVRCTCVRDGTTRSVWPEDDAFCEDLERTRRGPLTDVALRQCGIR